MNAFARGPGVGFSVCTVMLLAAPLVASFSSRSSSAAVAGGQQPAQQQTFEAEAAHEPEATPGALNEPILFHWIIARDLSLQLVTIDYFDETEIGYRAEGDDLRTMPRDEVLAIVLARKGDRTPDWAWQRLAEAMVTDEPEPWWRAGMESGPAIDYAPGDDINLWTLDPEGAIREVALRSGLFDPFEEETPGAEGGVNPGIPAAQPAPPWIELTDGQRWSGQLLLLPQGRASTRNDPASRVPTWTNDYVWRQPIDLERVHRMKLIGPAPDPVALDLQTAANDVVVLTNGDLVRGFLAELSVIDRVARVEDLEGNVTAVPLDRVAGLSLVNPMTEPDGIRVFQRKGDEMLVKDVAIDGFTLELSIEGREPFLEGLDTLAGINLDAAVLRPLAALPLVAVEPVGDLRLPEPPAYVPRHDPARREVAPLRLSDVVLRGPVAVTWDLPEQGATRFAALAAVPDVSAPLADFTLEIAGVSRSGEATLVYEGNFERTQPLAEIAVELEPGFDALRMTIRDAGGGPVHDAVRLHLPRLRLAPPK